MLHSFKKLGHFVNMVPQSVEDERSVARMLKSNKMLAQ
jgi:hypothetical protein